jgi:hypothetical protein
MGKNERDVFAWIPVRFRTGIQSHETIYTSSFYTKLAALKKTLKKREEGVLHG